MLPKIKLRILPLFIFTAVLTLSVRISHIVDNLQENHETHIEFGGPNAGAAEVQKAEGRNLR